MYMIGHELKHYTGQCKQSGTPFLCINTLIDDEGRIGMFLSFSRYFVMADKIISFKTAFHKRECLLKRMFFVL